MSENCQGVPTSVNSLCDIPRNLQSYLSAVVVMDTKWRVLMMSPESVVSGQAWLPLLKQLKDVWLPQEGHNLVIIGCEGKE